MKQLQNVMLTQTCRFGIQQGKCRKGQNAENKKPKEDKREVKQKEEEEMKTHSFQAAWYRSECPLGNSSNP